ncbi:CPBP family intramembrane glutamic endopeptidase [Listeria sp. PSOL-1]|uniref:CPBP family intramembrane glutamic endopeptidase n=1 Tax=Listeria sp. PSOL-1 TaxID=1844999 RepID=UPI0013D24046|nr:CPBP family intramembrane glutamic endopeptidase [Listeria sp. PSOL-1]
MKSSKIDLKLIIGLIISAILIFITFNYTESFWYIYGASMLFLLSFSIFTVDLKKRYSFFGGLIPAIFSSVVLYIIFYLGALLLKILPFGLDKSVRAAFSTFATDSWPIWLLLIVAIIPGEEIFWRGFVLNRLLKLVKPWLAIVISTALITILISFSDSFALIISTLIANLFWNLLYLYRPSLLMTYLSHVLFIFLLLSLLPIY